MLIPDVVIHRANRAATSRLGNPSWYLITNIGPIRTAANSSLGYSVENMIAPTYRAATAREVIGNPRATVTLETNARGYVIHVRDSRGDIIR
jgi:hypothetical protein